jgi:signal peptidase I
MKKNENAAILRSIFLAVALALVMKLFFFDFMVTQGESMNPAIKNGSVLVINRLAYGFRPPLYRRYICRWALPENGSIVVFYTPSGDLVVKRCSRVMKSGNFIALGDNSLESYDSRSYGPVPFDNIVGKVVGIK